MRLQGSVVRTIRLRTECCLYGCVRQEVIKILSIELKHSVEKMKDGQGEGQLKRDLSMENSWLLFTCRQKQVPSKRHLHELPVCRNGKEIQLREADVRQSPNALRAFVMSCHLPRPGDIQVIVGGPPCQGVRHPQRKKHSDEVLPRRSVD